MKWITVFAYLLLTLTTGAQEREHHIEKVEIISHIKPSETTMQRTVMDTTLLQAMQNSTLADLLIQNSPINIKSYGRGDTQSATFRGTAPSHTAVYWNGVKINSPMVGSVDLGQIPLFFVDKLTVDAGVSAMAVTGGALGGAVNIESAPQWGKKFGMEAVQSLGSFTTSDSYLNLIFGGKHLQSSTKLFYTYSKNDFEFINRDIIDPARPDYRPTQRNENADYRRTGFMQEIFGRIDSKQTLSAIVWGLSNIANLPQLTTYEGDKSNNLTNRNDASLRAAITYKKYGELFDFSIRLTGDVQSMGFEQQNRTGLGYQTTIDSRGVSRSMALTLDGTIKASEKHNIGLRATAQYDFVDSREGIKNVGFCRNRNEGSILAALYSAWSEKWSSSVATRLSVVGSEIYATPFAGLEYRLSSPFSLKARVGYNVHSPSISDLYFVPGGNEELKPERGITAEIGAAYLCDNARVDINIFSSWISDWIVWLPSHQQYWTPQNIRSVSSRGIELTASNRWSWGKWGLYTNLNFTLNSTINNGEQMTQGDESVGKQLVYVPLLSGGVYAKGSYRNWWLSYQIYGESEKFTTTSNNQSEQSIIAPYTLSDIAGGYNWRMLSAEIKCKNIFNPRYYTVLRRPLPGISVEATIRLKI